MNNVIEYKKITGAPVYKKSECKGKLYENWPLVTNKNGLKVGDKVYTCIFGVYCEGIVCKHEELYVDTKYNITNLFFNGKWVEIVR